MLLIYIPHFIKINFLLPTQPDKNETVFKTLNLQENLLKTSKSYLLVYRSSGPFYRKKCESMIQDCKKLIDLCCAASKQSRIMTSLLSLDQSSVTEEDDDCCSTTSEAEFGSVRKQQVNHFVGCIPGSG